MDCEEKDCVRCSVGFGFCALVVVVVVVCDDSCNGCNGPFCGL